MHHGDHTPRPADDALPRDPGAQPPDASEPPHGTGIDQEPLDTDAPREFYSRFFARLDLVLLALLALLWALNRWLG